MVEEAARQEAAERPDCRRSGAASAATCAGYNQYLRDKGVDDIPDRRCRGKAWVRPIKQIDVYRRFFQLGILASSGAVIDGIVNASPSRRRRPRAARAPARDARDRRGASAATAADRLERLRLRARGHEQRPRPRLGNPHFPWDGSERLYQAHLRIPGEVDVAGRTLYGVPLILIGHTRGLAWSHTVATAWRFTPFKLTLPPGDPHSYVVDGETKPMEATEVKVGDESRTIYSTEYGPMITDLVGIPLPWTDGHRLRAEGRQRDELPLPQPLPREQQRAERRRVRRGPAQVPGDPVGQLDRGRQQGQRLLLDAGRDPVRAGRAGGRVQRRSPGFAMLGLPILDGSRSECDWRSSDEAVAPGTFPPDEVPTLIRPDYVTNGNDSHWLTNPEEPLTGFDRIIGIEDAERTLRTRLGLIQVEDRLAGSDGLPGNRFSRKLLQKVASATASTRASSGATASCRCARARPAGSARLDGPGRRERRVRAARQVGPARQPRLEWRDRVPALRLRRS